MSSKEEPPRKKIKQENSSTRVLRSHGLGENEAIASTRATNHTNARTRDKSSQKGKAMSESRRRSSRKNRNAELKDNEQSIEDSASLQTPSSHKKSSRHKSTSEKHIQEQLDEQEEMLEAGEDEQAMPQVHEEDEEEDYVDEENMAEARQTGSASRSSINEISLAAMASLLSPNQSGTLKSLLSSLREPDPSVQLMALNELANVLSMSTEESLAGHMQVDALVTELIEIMRGPNVFGEDNPEMMLLACRCLANLMEAMPSSTAHIAYGGAVPVLCQKLLEIEFIDLAEQALSTLEKISKDYPSTIVREGGLSACLTYLDFFSTNVQRIAVNTAANCAKNVPANCYAIVRDVMPTLQNVIVGSDSKVVEAGCLCVTRILESFRSNSSHLEELLAPSFLASVLLILSPAQSNGITVPEFIKTRLLHILALSARSSEKFSLRLLQQDVIGIVYQLLTGLTKPSTSQEIRDNSVVVLQALIHRPREQITESIALLSNILPGLPDEELFAGLAHWERGMSDTRHTLFQAQCPKEYQEFVSIVLPTLIDMYNSTINMSLRKVSLSALLKICYNLDVDVLTGVVSDIPLACFITGVLGAREDDLVLSGVRLANILLDRVPSIYAHKLKTEGCVSQLQELARNLRKSAENNPEKSRTLGLSQSHDISLLEANVIPTDSPQANDADQFEAEFLIAGDEDDVDADENVVDREEEDENVDDENEDEDEDDNEEEADDVSLDSEVDLEEDQESSGMNEIETDGRQPQTKPDSSTDQKSQAANQIIFWAERFKLAYDRLDVNDEWQNAICYKLEKISSILISKDSEAAFSTLAEMFSTTPDISSYHLRSTGILAALLQALSGPAMSNNRSHFIRCFANGSALSVLVLKLQEMLTWTERFDVLSTSAHEDRRSSNILAKQIRLKLVADDDCDVSKQFRVLMVSIHAIATFKALDDYLRPRIQASGRGSRTSTPTSSAGQTGNFLGRAPEGLQGVLAQLASAGTSLPESIRERLAGLGVDATAFLRTEAAGTLAQSRQANNSSQFEDDDAGPAVSVEIPTSGGKAIAKTAQGQRIPTPRIGTPQQSPAKNTTESKSAGVEGRRSGMSYAAAVTSTPKDWHIQFELDGKILAHETTIFGAIHGVRAVGDASTHGRPGSSLYQITFRKVPGPVPLASFSNTDVVSEERLPVSLQQDSEVASILQLLDILHSMSINWRDLSPTGIHFENLTPASFVNTKLTAKLNRQLEEPLIVASQCLPQWAQDLPRHYPFLFPFETRYLFLQSTSFGYSRSMARWQAATKRENDSRSFLGRLQRQKVRISRPRMLESATKVMELYGASPSVLEVEYFDEVGTGLGPTLEFYSTVSKEISKKKFNLWRAADSVQDSEYIYSIRGLFPRPLHPKQNEQNAEVQKKTMLLFRTIGTFLARAMLDSRLVDIPFNATFFKILSDTNALLLSIGSVATVDESLSKSLFLLEKFAVAYKELKIAEKSPEEIAQEASSIQFDNTRISDLGLDFTYPGLPDLELVPGGSAMDVTIENVADYLDRVIDLTLQSGISRQCAAFKEGFSQVFPYSALRAFTPMELTVLFGRADEDWSIQNLTSSMKADHGFSMESSTVRNLIIILSELNDLDRRDFLQFITGSPKLPIGGFKSLTPQLTVVCKPHEAPLTADDYLPSVMTCVNYLKLPDYSSIDILKAKLLIAMKEGSGSFHLS